MSKLKKLSVVAAGSMLPAAAFAEEVVVVAAQNTSSAGAAPYYAAGACMAIAAAVGTYSQSRAASAAFEGMSRNPAVAKEMFTPMIISLALMESLVLFSFVIAILMALK